MHNILEIDCFFLEHAQFFKENVFGNGWNFKFQWVISKLLWKENLDSVLFFTMAFAKYGNFTINMQGDWRFEIVVNISSAVVVFLD